MTRDTFADAVALLKLASRLLAKANTPASRLASQMIEDILRND
jgi:hypothetical protein